METNKKAWETPQLIIMVKSKPEELVLGDCKYNQGGPLGPETTLTCVNVKGNGACRGNDTIS